MPREIVLDTETTGTDSASDRVIEVAAVEVDGTGETGRVFHRLYDPCQEIHPEATRVHGHTWESLRGKPLFEDDAAELAEFLDGATLVIHNASFDLGFLRAEFAKARVLPRFGQVVDTLAMARRRHPGAAVSLDALLDRYGIDRSVRVKHGALIDVRLLFQLYVKMSGRDQLIPMEEVAVVRAAASDAPDFPVGARQSWFPDRRASLQPLLTDEEAARHVAFTGAMKTPAIWGRFAV